MSGTVENALYTQLSTLNTNLSSLISIQTNLTPNVFKQISATASGNTAVWTPTSGKKFVLLGYVISVTANAALAAAGVLTVTFQDATTPIGLGYGVFVPAAAGSNFQDDSTPGFIPLGQGYTSSTINNVLNVNLGTALTAGVVHVMTVGREI